MKRGLAIIAALVMLASFSCGCADNSAAVSENAAVVDAMLSAPQPAKDGFAFAANGTKVYLHQKADEVVEKLGSYSYFEAASCAFEGLDKTYDYGSFALYTYPIGEVDYVSSIVFNDDAAVTSEGIYIGCEKAQVTDIYGAPTEESDTLLRYEKGKTEMKFILSDGKVTSVQYNALFE